MKDRAPVRFAALVLGLSAGLAGCARAPLEGPEPEPTPVTVSYPVERDVTDRRP